MKIAIDKHTLPKIRNLKEDEYIYIFDDEPEEELFKLGIHCIRKDYVKGVDINLTDYQISCRKKANIDDKNWKELPIKAEHTYAIIVPNYNNDHRRL